MVAVFGSMQMAVSRVIKLQHHRIAQVLARILEMGVSLSWGAHLFAEAGLGVELTGFAPSGWSPGEEGAFPGPCG